MRCFLLNILSTLPFVLNRTQYWFTFIINFYLNYTQTRYATGNGTQSFWNGFCPTITAQTYIFLIIKDIRVQLSNQIVRLWKLYGLQIFVSKKFKIFKENSFSKKISSFFMTKKCRRLSLLYKYCRFSFFYLEK